MCGVRPKFWEGGWIEMEKSKRTFRGSYPAYALTYFFFYWSLGVFTSVLSMYLTGIGKSKAEMSFIMSASSLFGVVLIPIVGYINDKLRKPRLICTVMMACVAVFGILFALVRETMLLFLLNGCIMGFISSLSPVSERMATSTKYRYGTNSYLGHVRLCGGRTGGLRHDGIYEPTADFCFGLCFGGAGHCGFPRHGRHFVYGYGSGKGCGGQAVFISLCADVHFVRHHRVYFFGLLKSQHDIQPHFIAGARHADGCGGHSAVFQYDC